MGEQISSVKETETTAAFNGASADEIQSFLSQRAHQNSNMGMHIIESDNAVTTSSIGDFKPDYVSLHLSSYHVGSDGYYADISEDPIAEPLNEINPGLALGWNVTENIGIEAGAYENSHEDVSAYGVVSYTFFEYSNLSLAGFAGAVSGYEDVNDRMLSPLVGARADYSVNDSISARLGVFAGSGGEFEAQDKNGEMQTYNEADAVATFSIVKSF